MAQYTKDQFARRAAIIKKEAFVVGFWILIGALCLWGFDEAGLLSRDSQVAEVVVDFPEVYQIWKKESAMFVDSRPASAFAHGHIPGAVSVPLGQVKERLAALPEDKDAGLIVYCSSAECPNGYQLLHRLQQHGYTHVRLFQGGIAEWLRFGYPLQKTIQQLSASP